VRPRLAIVSLHAHRRLAPRGERTRRLAEALGRDWDVEIVAPPATVDTGGASGRGGSSPARRLAARAVGSVLLDKWEPWSVRNLRDWRPAVDAALLIGHPFSPLVYAARRLAAAEIPYVVDAGDPWVLTDPAAVRRSIGLVRARRAERAIWSGAAGAVLTTDQQAAALRALFPSSRTLVRPNGYEPSAAPPAPTPPERDDGELRLIHMGMLSTARLDPRPLLQTLAESGRWRRIVLAQLGDDFAGLLDSLPAGVAVERDRSYPWDEVVRRSLDYDLAVVVGNVNPGQLPSKAVQYLTLPIPRLAITEGSPSDALASYARDTPGWLALSPGDPLAADRVAAHLAADWSGDRLSPPAAESWPGVARTIADFVQRCVMPVPDPAAPGGRTP
jgi:hypothetical protein